MMNSTFFTDQYDWGSVVLDVEHMPSYHPSTADDPIEQLQSYFVSFIDRYSNNTPQCFILPSLSDIAEFLDVKPELMIQVLKALRNMGYDNMAGGLYGHITLWKPSELVFSEPFI